MDRKADFAGTARNSAVGFSIGNKGYIGTGHNYSYFRISKKIFGNGTRRLMYGHRKPTWQELHEHLLLVFQSGTKDI